MEIKFTINADDVELCLIVVPDVKEHLSRHMEELVNSLKRDALNLSKKSQNEGMSDIEIVRASGILSYTDRRDAAIAAAAAEAAEEPVEEEPPPEEPEA